MAFQYYSCGVSLHSDLKLDLPPQCRSDRLKLSYRLSSLDQLDTDFSKPVYTSKTVYAGGNPALSIRHSNQTYLLDAFRIAVFAVEQQVVTAYSYNKVSESALADYFVRIVLPFWLESQQHPVIHASVIGYKDQAIGFVGDSGSGKSTLAASFLADNETVLADDKLVVHSLPGLNFYTTTESESIRLTSEASALFSDGLLEQGREVARQRFEYQIVTDATTNETHNRLRIGQLIFLNRGDHKSIGLQAIRGKDALVELVKCSLFSPELYLKMGWQSERLQTLSKLVETSSLWSLSYPTGLDHLAAVRESIYQTIDSI